MAYTPFYGGESDMAIPLFGEIERLINEHGSANILRERLALAADKYDVLEEKVASLGEENAKLRSENQRLQLDKNKLREEIEGLRQQLGNDRRAGLTPDEEAIIKLLANRAHSLTSQQIASHMEIHRTKAEHFLHKLYDNNYVGMAGNYSTGQTTYFLYPKGKEYAVEHGYV